MKLTLFVMTACLHIFSLYVLLNFLIRSQLIAKMECSVVGARACREKGGTNTKVGIGAGAGIKASSSKDVFGLS